MVDKTEADYLGKPQLKTVLNFVKYIIVIAEARRNTFDGVWHQDLQNMDAFRSWELWNRLLVDAENMSYIINKILDPKLEIK